MLLFASRTTLPKPDTHPSQPHLQYEWSRQPCAPNSPDFRHRVCIGRICPVLGDPGSLDRPCSKTRWLAFRKKRVGSRLGKNCLGPGSRRWGWWHWSRARCIVLRRWGRSSSRFQCTAVQRISRLYCCGGRRWWRHWGCCNAWEVQDDLRIAGT